MFHCNRKKPFFVAPPPPLRTLSLSWSHHEGLHPNRSFVPYGILLHSRNVDECTSSTFVPFSSRYWVAERERGQGRSERDEREKHLVERGVAGCTTTQQYGLQCCHRPVSRTNFPLLPLLPAPSLLSTAQACPHVIHWLPSYPRCLWPLLTTLMYRVKAGVGGGVARGGVAHKLGAELTNFLFLMKFCQCD